MAMYAGPIDDPWKDDPAGTYWTPPERVSLAEISPVLMAKVLLITDRQRVSIYGATAFDMQSGGPIGQFEVAVDQKEKRAFGVFGQCGHDTHAPKVFAFSGDGDAAIEAFYAIAQTEGYVL
jgi:hypothetical protein